MKKPPAARDIRAWRHPSPSAPKWHPLAWDGDAMSFDPDDGVSSLHKTYLNPGDNVSPLPPGAPPRDFLEPQLRPHEHLKFHPQYRTRFDQKLTQFLKTPPPGGGPPLLSQAALLARFDTVAQDFRRTLECEVMRWGEFQSRFQQTPQPAWELPTKWENNINTVRNTVPSAKLLLARNRLKKQARESRLLNDIPPPVITVSGNNFTIAQPGPAGRIYYFVEDGEKDPADFEIEPELIPVRTIISGVLPSGQTTITARVYRKDLDDTPAWSAKTVWVLP
jgi:hypothetical protein